MVDLVVDAALVKESVVVLGMDRLKRVKCSVQECANGSVHARM